MIAQTPARANQFQAIRLTSHYKDTFQKNYLSCKNQEQNQPDKFLKIKSMN